MLTVLAQFLDPGEGPPQSGDFEVSPTAFVLLLVSGFLVGIVGHVVKSKTLVAAGVLAIFLATIVIPLYFAITR